MNSKKVDKAVWGPGVSGRIVGLLWHLDSCYRAPLKWSKEDLSDPNMRRYAEHRAEERDRAIDEVFLSPLSKALRERNGGWFRHLAHTIEAMTAETDWDRFRVFLFRTFGPAWTHERTLEGQRKSVQSLAALLNDKRLSAAQIAKVRGWIKYHRAVIRRTLAAQRARVKTVQEIHRAAMTEGFTTFDIRHTRRVLAQLEIPCKQGRPGRPQTRTKRKRNLS